MREVYLEKYINYSLTFTLVTPTLRNEHAEVSQFKGKG